MCPCLCHNQARQGTTQTNPALHQAGQEVTTPLTQANLTSHNNTHRDDPGLGRYQALTKLMGSVTAARSLGINENVAVRDGIGRTRAADPLGRYLSDSDDRAAARLGYWEGDSKNRK